MLEKLETVSEMVSAVTGDKKRIFFLIIFLRCVSKKAMDIVSRKKQTRIMTISLTYRDKRESTFPSLFPLCFLYEYLQAQAELPKKKKKRKPDALDILKERKIVWSSVTTNN